jgi:hypothetical protein
MRLAASDRGDAGLADVIGRIEAGIAAGERDDVARGSRQLLGALRAAETLDRLRYFDQGALLVDRRKRNLLPASWHWKFADYFGG